MTNQKLDDDNGKVLGIGNVRYQEVRRISRNEFWKNICCLVSAHIFGLGGSRLWDKEEDIKISGKKRKRRSILIKVDFYEVCLSGIIYCLIFYFMTIPILFFFSRQICGISLTRGKEFKNYWPKVF